MTMEREREAKEEQFEEDVGLKRDGKKMRRVEQRVSDLRTFLSIQMILPANLRGWQSWALGGNKIKIDTQVGWLNRRN